MIDEFLGSRSAQHLLYYPLIRPLLREAFSGRDSRKYPRYLLRLPGPISPALAMRLTSLCKRRTPGNVEARWYVNVFLNVGLLSSRVRVKVRSHNKCYQGFDINKHFTVFKTTWSGDKGVLTTNGRFYALSKSNVLAR